MPQRVSFCLIVKNEETSLPACLDSVAGLVDETIVVDTGSTDGTKELARRRGARVFDFPWIDNFAAARNESLRHATGDWIFWMDADEWIDEENRGRMRALFAGLQPEMAGYSMEIRCLPNRETGAALVYHHVRLFPNHPQVRWKYRVHEQIILALEALGGPLRPTDVAIHHGGYQDSALRRRKNENYLRLLQLEDAEHPGDPVVHFLLGWTNLDLGRRDEAIAFLSQSVQGAWSASSSIRKAYALLVNCHYGAGDKQSAFAVCQQGRARFPDDTELIYMDAVLRRELGDAAGAEACLLYLLGGPAGTQQALSMDAGLRGYLAHNQLADVYFQQGRFAEAEAQWRAVTAERPDFTDAWLGLTEVWRRQGRVDCLPEAEEAAHRLEALHKPVDAALLHVRVLMARQEFAAARQLLEQAIARAPQVVSLRLILTHVLLLEGRDWEAAERALRDVLALDPNNQDASHNLAVLMRQLGRSATLE
jgi:tetratricopeptide (TPR) repeat protein